MNNPAKNIPQEQADLQTKSEVEADSGATITPMMQQYLDVKARYKDYLLFYRMGDFFELFYDDAINASKALDIVLTRRGKAEGTSIPMCGVPHHAYESYLSKLIKLGFKVAICDQLETPEEAKKNRGYKAVVKRDVIRVVTPGTLTEDNLLDASACNYLLAINMNKAGELALAWCDISTGEICYTSTNKNDLLSEVERIAPKEIIINEELLNNKDFSDLVNNYRKILSSHSKSFFEADKSERKIKTAYGIGTIESFGKIAKEEVGAIGALIEYLEITQVSKLPRLSAPKRSAGNSFMEIDSASFSNLEIFRAASDGGVSLFALLNQTCTNAGSRNLQKILARPLLNKKEIESRLDAVEFFIKNENISGEVRELLKSIPDFERILSRVHLNRSTPRDLAALRDGLKAALKLSEVFTFAKDIKAPAELKENIKNLGNFDSLIRTLDEAIVEFPPIALNMGGFIKEGYNPKLDDYRNIRQNSEKIKNDLQDKYIKETGINTLKIKDNNVIGMFVEVTAMHMEKIPSYFIHRQSLANNIRYTTDELRKVENEIINAASYAINLENDLYHKLREEIILFGEKLVINSGAISNIDVFATFAFLAEKNNYCRPEITENVEFLVEDGRHPIVESSQKNKNEKQQFITNSLSITSKQNIWLLTGPNMSGKSTFLRQNALIAIMAQLGSFVPAKSVKLGVVDKVFSRVGASDNIAKGHSTFMVEMIETASILNNSTEKSFVILDEIGRGTATFDGLAIAWSVLEHIHDNIKCRCLFATHYHELNSLEKELKNLACYTTQIKEWNGEIIFMHKVIEGKANQSYGVHVAKLAGIPKNVIGRANEILAILVRENKGNENEILASSLPLFNSETEPKNEKNASKPDGEFINSDEKEILNQIKDIDTNNISPIQALNILVELSKKLQS